MDRQGLQVNRGCYQKNRQLLAKVDAAGFDEAFDKAEIAQ